MADGLGAKQRSGGRGSGAGQRGAGGVGTLRFWLSRTPLGRAALGRAASGPRPMLLAKPAHDPHRRLALLVLIPLAVATVAFGVLVLYKHVLGGGAVFQGRRGPGRGAGGRRARRGRGGRPGAVGTFVGARGGVRGGCRDLGRDLARRTR